MWWREASHALHSANMSASQTDRDSLASFYSRIE